MKKVYLLSLLLTLALASCKDGKDDPVPQPEPEAQTPQPGLKVRTVTFNFRNDLVPWEADRFELIVSQKDGKVLLDTLLWQTANNVLTVKSTDTKFDITTVYQHPPSKEYSIRTYVQVDPDNWHIGHVEFWNPGETEAAEIQFTNVPPPTFDYLYQSKIFSVINSIGYSNSTWDGKGTLTLNYRRSLSTDTAYLMLTELGKYVFAPVTSA